MRERLDDLLGSGCFYGIRDFAHEATIVGRCRAHDRRRNGGELVCGNCPAFVSCAQQIGGGTGETCCVQSADCVKSIPRN